MSLTVEPGEIVALIGPGKTTLLRAATGMIKAWHGTIRLGLLDLTACSIEEIALTGVAHVPEGRRLFPGLTVRDNLRLRGWRTRSSDLTDVPELFPRLKERINQVAGSMSGGEQQMCAIARALMSQPAILVIDELSLGLAPVLVEEIMSRLIAVPPDAPMSSRTGKSRSTALLNNSPATRASVRPI